MVNLLAGTFVIISVSLALKYILNEKKKGHGCVGCPSANKCSKLCEIDFAKIKEEAFSK